MKMVNQIAIKMGNKTEIDKTEDVPDTSPFFDISQPNLARIFNYLIGGSAHFEVDREEAERMLTIMPSLRKWTRLRRAFVQEAVFDLDQKGFKQFIDLAAGMPAEDHIHHFLPRADIVYSDINPVAISHGNSLFANLPRVNYLMGDAKKIDQFLINLTNEQLINGNEKVAIGLNALFLFLSPSECKQLAQELYDWAPQGSQIFLAFQTRADIPLSTNYQQYIERTKRVGLPLQLYLFDQYVDMLKPWQPLFVEPLPKYLGLPDDFMTDEDQEGIGVAFYAAFLGK